MATAALLASALALDPAAPARALDFQCIEPSRYKHLLPVFNDDPNVFFSYFGLPRGRLPDLEICRALHVSGTLAEGDADALLDRIVQGKGWLAALYLSFEGVNLEEEARIAIIIRSFALKTRAIRSDFSIYVPDFVIRWEPPLPMTGTSAAAPPLREDISPLYRGIRTYQTRRDLRLKLDPNHSTCNDGCRTAWFAGVNRLYNAPAANAKTAPEPDPAVNRAAWRSPIRSTSTARPRRTTPRWASRWSGPSSRRWRWPARCATSAIRSSRWRKRSKHAGAKRSTAPQKPTSGHATSRRWAACSSR